MCYSFYSNFIINKIAQKLLSSVKGNKSNLHYGNIFTPFVLTAREQQYRNLALQVRTF